MPKGYTTKAKLENYILQDIDATFNTQINEWISSVEKIIDEITQRNFVADASASARLFDGDGSQELLIDDCVEITKVEVGVDSYGASFLEVAATGADRYFAYPSNAIVKELPFYKLVLNARSWAHGRQNNRITAKWGYSVTCPEDIEFAATVFLAGIVNQSRGAGEQIKSEKIGNYQVTYNSENGNDSWSDFERAKEILEKRTKLGI